ncbi:Uncharacterised protein [Mycobacteroides abscessus]|nr:Uncharacterised protein [Mycobacteroides abscessus]
MHGNDRPFATDVHRRQPPVGSGPLTTSAPWAAFAAFWMSRCVVWAQVT